MQARILVVDDEQGIRQSLAGVLGDEGLQVRTVGTAAECLQALREGSYELMLLDIWLPD
ncbi:MAG: response regulator, partial [Terriglobales bacterium]